MTTWPKKNPVELLPKDAELLESIFFQNYKPPASPREIPQRIHSVVRAAWLKIRTEVDRRWPYDLYDAKYHIEMCINSNKFKAPRIDGKEAQSRRDSSSLEKAHGNIIADDVNRRKFLQRVASGEKRVDLACEFEIHPARVALLFAPALIREAYPKLSTAERDNMSAVLVKNLPEKCVSLCDARGWNIEEFDREKWPRIPDEDEIHQMIERGKSHLVVSPTEKGLSDQYGRGGVRHRASGSPLPAGAIAQNLYGRGRKRRHHLSFELHIS